MRLVVLVLVTLFGALLGYGFAYELVVFFHGYDHGHDTEHMQLVSTPLGAAMFAWVFWMFLPDRRSQQ